MLLCKLSIAALIVCVVLCGSRELLPWVTIVYDWRSSSPDNITNTKAPTDSILALEAHTSSSSGLRIVSHLPLSFQSYLAELEHKCRRQSHGLIHLQRKVQGGRGSGEGSVFGASFN